MSVAFHLGNAHPAYQKIIRGTLTALAEQYPIAGLRTVRLFHGKPGNRSMGNSSTPHVIEFNAFWFTQSPDVLHAAGEVDDTIPRAAVGDVALRWHGGLAQPWQVIVHEMMHEIHDGIGRDAEDFARSLWHEATIDPSLAPTGYAMTDWSEFFAEAGCMHEAGNPHDNRLVEEFGLFMRDYRS